MTLSVLLSIYFSQSLTFCSILGKRKSKTSKNADFKSKQTLPTLKIVAIQSFSHFFFFILFLFARFFYFIQNKQCTKLQGNTDKILMKKPGRLSCFMCWVHVSINILATVFLSSLHWPVFFSLLKIYDFENWVVKYHWQLQEMNC